MKKLFASFISMMLVLSALSFNHPRATARAASLPLTQGGAGGGGGRIRFVQRQIREANRRLRYTIKARYPQAIGAKDARLVRLNAELKSLATREVNDFKKDFEAPQQRMGTMGSDYDMSYVVEYASNDLISIGFSISSFYEGAAHPLHGTLAFNYDLKSGKRLDLSDLFKRNSNYLTTISDYAVKALKKELGPDSDSDWIQTGAGPKDENYKSWNITPKGLQVIFDPYQVASYAEGQHVVLIPYSVLKNVMDTGGPLARISSR